MIHYQALAAATWLVSAQPAEEPKGTVGTAAPASSGTTEIEGTDQFATSADPSAEETDALELQIAAGGIFNTGNSRSLAATVASDFRVRRSIHQFGAKFAGNYARSAPDSHSDYETTVGNAQGRARYDVFFAERWAAFGMVTARHDPFQGLDLRLNVDPGIAFYAIIKSDHRLWFEAGYDFQYDIRTDEARLLEDEAGNLVLDDEGEPIVARGKERSNHAARLFAGYSNRLNEHVAFDTGLEYLQSVVHARRWRFNWDVGLTTSLGKILSLATTFTMRIDNDPVPGVKKLDTITAVSLVVSLLGAKDKK